VASTLAYLVLFVLLSGPLGDQAGNAVALLVTAVANTSANRRFTFGTRGRDRAVRHQAQGLVVFGVGLAVTSLSLAGLHAVVRDPATLVEVTVLVVANLTATLLRFVLFRAWVFRAAQTARVRPSQASRPRSV
jgi:putative flippase GtrA